MTTEITDKEKFNGWVLYDGDCRRCIRLARRFEHLLAERHFKLLPLQTPWVRARLRLPEARLLAEMRLLRSDGKFFGGADSLLEIARHFWWAWVFSIIGRVPPVKNVLRACSRWVARNRDCANGQCEIRRQSRFVDILPLVILPWLALAFRTDLAAWMFMWAMAFALYFGCKWLTYREALRNGLRPGLPRVLAYLLLWPGMDADGFLDIKIISASPRKAEWTFAVAKTIFGIVLVWGLARTLISAHPVPAGWVGMIGIVFILHFGWFHVLSLIWRRAGFKATPLMQNPIASTSLAEFWGRRWNTAFHELAFQWTFRPLRRLMPPMAATLLVFGLSGSVHESVISLPAHGGYGLPTLYFLVQGIGTILERSRFGRGIGLGRGARGWFFTFIVTVVPVYWLFHPPFIKNVILPMLTAIGAT